MDLPCHSAHTMNLYVCGILCGCVCCVLRAQHHFPNRLCCFTLDIPTYAWYTLNVKHPIYKGSLNQSRMIENECERLVMP